MTIAERATGVVKWFNDEKGFGFIVVQDQDKDVFVHRQQLVRSGLESLKEGDRVSCLIQDGRKGKFATGVSKI